MGSKGPSRELINGPVVSRGCTDILFLLLFLAALVLYAAVAYLSFDQGDPDRYVHEFYNEDHFLGFYLV
jgi:hypothetical protein